MYIRYYMAYACWGSAERVDYIWPEVAGVFTFNRDGGFRYYRKSAGENARAISGSFPAKPSWKNGCANTAKNRCSGAAHCNSQYILIYLWYTNIMFWCVQQWVPRGRDHRFLSKATWDDFGFLSCYFRTRLFCFFTNINVGIQHGITHNLFLVAASGFYAKRVFHRYRRDEIIIS